MRTLALRAKTVMRAGAAGLVVCCACAVACSTGDVGAALDDASAADSPDGNVTADSPHPLDADAERADSGVDVSHDAIGDAASDTVAPLDTTPPTDTTPPPTYARTSGLDFVFPDGKKGFVGMNARGLPHYGHATPMLPYATSGQVDAQLSAAKTAGARVVRVFAAGHDADASTVAARLGPVLDAARSKGIFVIVALTDLYNTGLSPQGDDGEYVTIGGYTLLGDAWFTGNYKTHYLPFVDAVVGRYKDHPAVFAWELGNELKDVSSAANYATFAKDVAAHIRGLDGNHMITTGAISTMSNSLRAAGDTSSTTLAYKLYSDANVSFLTTHDYDGAMGDDDTDLAKALSKPIVIEEEGFSTADGDRPSLVLTNGRAWRAKGARGFMQWGLMATGSDNGDGDRTYGMDDVFHAADYAGLQSSYRTLAAEYE